MDEGPLVAWLGLLMGSPGLSLETFVLERLFVDALRVIAPKYVAAAAATEGEEGAVFEAAFQALDRAELHFPLGSPLLRVEWHVLLGAADGGLLSVAQRHEAIKVAKLLLGAAVKCTNKATFVSQIQRGLPPAVQKALMVVIQQELLKEPLPTREEKLLDERQLRQRVADLEALAADREVLAQKNAQLMASCAALERELETSRAVSAAKAAPAAVASVEGGEEQRMLRERLRLVMAELAQREEENVQLAAAAAEAAARVRENRQLRDEVDLARETIAEMRQSLQEAAASAAAASASTAMTKELAAVREQAKAAQAEARAQYEANAKLRTNVAQLRAECSELASERNELKTAESLLRAQLERATTGYLESKAQLGELSLQLENARRETSALRQMQSAVAVATSEPPKPGGGSLADEIVGESLQAELSLKNEQLRLLEEERDQLLEDLKRAKTSGKADDKSGAEDKAVLAAQAEQMRQQEERVRALEAERDQLRQYLKMAKEKLVAAQPVAASVPCGHELELKTMAAKVHSAGAEILRLRNELRQDRAPDPNKHNGLLNHLRHAIDSFSM